MNAQNDASVWTAIKVIADAWQAQSAKILAYASTGYSFEEWLNWEAYYACKASYSPDAKPNYSAYGVAGSLQKADLFLKPNGQRKILIEIGLVHDETSHSKWQEKLTNDQAKLRKVPARDYSRIQVVLNACLDTKEIAHWCSTLSHPDRKFWPDEKRRLERVLVWKI